ncbi:tripartite-type tricarboxylate transporter receptor subunit TctC [Nocardioides sp. BE266]|uniref:tripartite tricarboxylate transporter substrate binding protein n=1 Tax=Nocardioides sp. BE266 TaxID=2817725 RepID=UPI0028663657|nr:tripartite tricarboxylate transporter substrate binding protein [Nocardioides sp. BE266]MDR7254194.1 tripartite-type tricarboxylate transporter receptor subunit TctC [Nocardioides sp. BE266]
METYPSGTIRIIAPFAAGGISDATARVAGSCLEEELDGTFIVENQDGGGGAIGMTQVAQAKPDGSTLAVSSMSTAALVPMTTDGAEFSGDSFTPVRGITLAPSVLVVKGSSSWQDADAVMAAAEAEDGKFSVAMPGARGIFALTMDAITDAGGPEFTTVPFESNDQSAAAVLGGNADSAYLSTSPTLLEQLESGELRAVATGATEPVDFLEGVPTFAEVGYDDLPGSMVNVALLGPAGLDAGIRDMLEGALDDCIASGAADVLGEEFVRDDDAGHEVLGQEFETAESQWAEALSR